MREFRGAPEPAVAMVGLPHQLACRAVKLRRADAAAGCERTWGQRDAQLLAGVLHIVAPRPVRIGDRCEHRRKAAQPHAVLWWKVRAAEEGKAARCQEHGHGPAAMAAHRL